jgi:hypothetical protein
MQSSRLAVAALMAGVVLAGAARGEKMPVPTQPAPKRPASLAPVNDPAEPPLSAEVSSGGSGLTVASSARGTTLKFNTPGTWQGSAALTFKRSAPMRFTLTLAQMPSYNLEALTLTCGKVSLAVGPVSAGATTKYYDAKGKAQDAPEGAAYTVTARRWDGEVDVQVRRSPGAALTVSWRSDLGWGRAFPGER